MMFSLTATAQNEIKIVDIELINTGTGQLYCFYKDSKQPVEGQVRIIDGTSSNYVDAEFDEKGFATGQWKTVANGALVAESSYINGYAEGIFREYSKDGADTLVESSYLAGKKNGVWKYYYPGGTLKEERQFKNDRANGTWKSFYPDGTPDTEKAYRDGVEDGIDKKHDADGAIRRNVHYTAGKRTGKAFEVISGNRGDITITSNYDKNGLRHGEYSAVFASGAVREKGKYAAGKKHNVWEYSSSNGTKLREEKYDKGVLVKLTMFYTNGQIETERELDADEREHGVVRRYANDGKLKSEEYYRHGKQHGKQMMHYTSNVANYICLSNYTDGKLDGDYSETYEETGKPKVIGKYVKGNRHGVWEIYDLNGELKKTEHYENGKMIE